MVDFVTVSARIPKKLNDDLEEYMQEGGYGSKTEVLRELLRGLLYQRVERMKGSFKGASKRQTDTLGDWRKKTWASALEQSGGNAKKAAALLDEKEREALSDLHL